MIKMSNNNTTEESVKKLIESIDIEIKNLEMNLLKDHIHSVMMGDESRIKELEGTKNILKSVFLIK